MPRKKKREKKSKGKEGKKKKRSRKIKCWGGLGHGGGDEVVVEGECSLPEGS